MFKSVLAKNVQVRTPIAYKIGEETLFGAAYKRPGGIVVFAASTKGHKEVKADARVEVSYTPETDATAGVRWCYKCDVEGGKHPMRVAADKHATAYCDVRDKAVRQQLTAERKTADPAAGQRAKQAEAKAEEREERITVALTRLAPSREQMVATVLAGRARVYGVDSNGFADAARGFGLTVEAARTLILGGHAEEQAAA